MTTSERRCVDGIVNGSPFKRGRTGTLVGDWTVISTNVFITNISAERLWDVDKPLPAQAQIAVNISLVGLDRKSDRTIEAPFVFTVNYNPSVAQISIKGKAHATGESDEISKLVDDHKQQKPPIPVIQAISATVIAEAILMSKSLGIPPPLPALPLPQEQEPQRTSTSRYTA